MNKFNTISINSSFQGNSSYWNKIVAIKKIPCTSVYTNTNRIYLKLLLTSYIGSLYDSGEIKQTTLVIDNFYFQNNLADTKNTHFYIDNILNVKVKILQDNEYIYIYVQNSDLTYGNYISCDVVESIGDTIRVTYYPNTVYETLPIGVTEMYPKLKATDKSKYIVQTSGSSDWTQVFKLFTLTKAESPTGYSLIRFRMKADTQNDLIYNETLLYISSMGSSNIVKFIRMSEKSPSYNIYYQVTSTDSSYSIDVYSACFSSGVKSTMELIEVENLNTSEITIYQNSPFIATTGLTQIPNNDISVNTVTVSSLIYTGNGATSSRPTTSKIGAMWYDTTLKKPIWYNGTSWTDSTGTIV